MVGLCLNLEIIACCICDCYYWLHMTEGVSGSCKGTCYKFRGGSSEYIYVSLLNVGCRVLISK